jgi:acyl carrier protein
MSTNEIMSGVTEILRDVVKNPNLSVTTETKASDVQGWDSLTNMILISRIEKQFGIRFHFREIMHLANVGDLCNAVVNKRN